MKIKYKTLRYNFLKVGQCEQTPHIKNITPLSGYWISILTYQQNLIKYCINRCIPTPIHRKETTKGKVLPVMTIALCKVGRNHGNKHTTINTRTSRSHLLKNGKPRHSFGQTVNTKTSRCRSLSSIHYQLLFKHINTHQSITTGRKRKVNKNKITNT